MSSTQVASPATNEKKHPLTRFSTQIVIGLIVGVLLGWSAAALGPNGEQPNWLTAVLKQTGSAYVGLLKLLVIPLVLTAVISSIARLREVTNAARLAVSTCQ